MPGEMSDTIYSPTTLDPPTQYIHLDFRYIYTVIIGCVEKGWSNL